MEATSRDTLLSIFAASIRAQRATSSSRVMVIFRSFRFITRLSCYTVSVSSLLTGDQRMRSGNLAALLGAFLCRLGVARGSHFSALFCGPAFFVELFAACNAQ